MIFSCVKNLRVHDKIGITTTDGSAVIVSYKEIVIDIQYFLVIKPPAAN